MKLEHFNACADWWGEGNTIAEKAQRNNRQQNEYAWKVSISEIVERNYNLDIKNPHVGETVSHDPDELLADYAKQQAEIQQLRDQLKGILAEALEGSE
jgi:type I restriction enzyme M protein